MAASPAQPAHRRRAPLVAPGHERAGSPAAVEGPGAPPTAVRSPLAGVAAGMATAIASAGLLYGLAAGPIYVLAQIATDGLDRPAFRTALVVALVVSTVLGIGIGIAVGIWFGRGGQLPTDRRSFSERTSSADSSSVRDGTWSSDR